MSFIKELRSYFVRANAPINPNVPEDHKDNLAKEGVPSQDTMERLMASHLSFRERTDRAKQEGFAYTVPAGTFASPAQDHELVGHVMIATDVQAKAWFDGIVETVGNERSVVVHAQQLPDVNSDTLTTTAFEPIEGDANAPATDIETITRTIDPGEGRRNNFLLRVSQLFQDVVNGVINNVNYINRVVLGTGGRGEPGADGTGITGLLWGDGNDGVDGTNADPSITFTLYGQDGSPGNPGDDGIDGVVTTITTEGVMQIQDNGSDIGTTTKTLNFYSDINGDILVTDVVPGTWLTRANFSPMSLRITNNTSAIGSNLTLINNNATAIDDLSGNDTDWVYVDQAFGTTIKMYKWVPGAISNVSLRPLPSDMTWIYSNTGVGPPVATNEKYFWRIQGDTMFIHFVDAAVYVNYTQFVGTTQRAGLGIILPGGREAINPNDGLDGIRGGINGRLQSVSNGSDSKWNFLIPNITSSMFDNSIPVDPFDAPPLLNESVGLDHGLIVIPLVAI